MTRRVHLDTLRESDPLTLEILTQEALRRPLVQLSGTTIAGMAMLAEVESLPKPLRRGFLAFVERMIQEVADLPAGEPFTSFLTELEALDPCHVPHSLRTALERELDSREELVRRRIINLLERWTAYPPQPIELGKGKPLIHRPSAKMFEDPRQKATSATRTRPARAEGGESRPKQRASAVHFVDEERHRRLAELVLERLSDYIDQGLREDVLVAGVRHRARAQYTDVTPAEISGILKELLTAGRLRQSAGRWKRNLGSW